MDADLLGSLKLHRAYGELIRMLNEEYSLLERQLRDHPSSSNTVQFVFRQGELRGGLDVLDRIYSELEEERGMNATT
jgi:hypothetical protein